MLTPQDLALPYADWNPGQMETIARIVASDKRIILLESPTGSGKSGSIVAASNMLDERLLVVTGTKQLQDQYHNSLSLLDVRGRNNFPCLLEPGRKADDAPCTIGQRCNHQVYTRHQWHTPEPHDGCDPCDRVEEVCPYYDQRYAGQAARQVVLNYAYWLTMANYAGAFTKRDLMVFDEAQTIEDEIRRFATVKFSRRSAETLSLKIPYIDCDQISRWQEWVRESRDKLKREISLLQANKLGPPTSDEDRMYRRALSAFARQSEMFLCMSADSWVGTPVKYNGVNTSNTEFKPVWIGPLANMLMYRHLGIKTVLMSGTILDRDLYCAQIGLDPESVDFIQVPSTFDASRRPFLYCPITKPVASNPDSMARLIVAVDKLIDMHPEESGIIHTVSYALARQILIGTKHGARMIGHESQDKAQQLALFRSTPGAIWISPSSGTGVDLPYDLCRWQIICKLPFPDMGDKQIKQMMKTQADGRPAPSASKWYNWATLCSILQMYGRGMRAPDDYCVTYLLDENWRWFRAATRHLLPGWVRAAMRTVN